MLHKFFHKLVWILHSVHHPEELFEAHAQCHEVDEGDAIVAAGIGQDRLEFLFIVPDPSSKVYSKIVLDQISGWFSIRVEIVGTLFVFGPYCTPMGARSTGLVLKKMGNNCKIIQKKIDLPN